jgi:hypothetical protein
MLRARWDAGIDRVIVEKVLSNGEVLGYARLTRQEFDSFLDHAAIVRRESWGGQTGDPWDVLEHVTEPWTDERVELPCAVVDDPEADIPVVRFADGSARVDLEFSRAREIVAEDGTLIKSNTRQVEQAIDRRLRELGRE